ncbi:hypothetical protein Taro_026730 [Colocasia esculenta]|uniref:Uncharacterized protein n=1 Tax=Colocasia esculenta TaxID=4460 RepID=A0A843VC54_COLES|nr:hypothetical protein [Colocasia esculenta]
MGGRYLSSILLLKGRNHSQEERGSDDCGEISEYNRSRQTLLPDRLAVFSEPCSGFPSSEKSSPLAWGAPGLFIGAGGDAVPNTEEEERRRPPSPSPAATRSRVRSGLPSPFLLRSGQGGWPSPLLSLNSNSSSKQQQQQRREGGGPRRRRRRRVGPAAARERTHGSGGQGTLPPADVFLLSSAAKTGGPEAPLSSSSANRRRPKQGEKAGSGPKGSTGGSRGRGPAVVAQGDRAQAGESPSQGPPFPLFC